MIFVTVGSQKFQFNRLLKAIDEQIESGKIADVVFAQIGFSDYIPKYFSYKNFLDRDEFSDWTSKSDIVITHGGTGAIIGAVKKKKKVIAVPRLPKYNEHVDEHQLQLIEQFKNLGLICECKNCDNLWRAVKKAKKTNYAGYESNTDKIIDSIEKFINK